MTNRIMEHLLDIFRSLMVPVSNSKRKAALTHNPELAG